MFRKFIHLTCFFLFCLLCSNGQTTTLSLAIKKSLPCVFVIKTFDKYDKELALGTGFFIDSLGSGITNYHVLRGAKSAKIYLQDGREYKIAYLSGEDILHDIIRFSISKSSDEISRIKFLKVSSKQSTIGDDVFTIGNPSGLSFSASNGIVSSVRNDEQLGQIIQTTAPISKGSSGSPLINLKGEVIGVVSFYLKDGQNLNFAYSSQYILQLKTEINYSFPKEDITDKEENFFKRQEWYGTQYEVKSNESSLLLSDEANLATSLPELEYLCNLSGKSYDLTYAFKAGRLSEISYWAIFKRNGENLITYSTLEEAFNVFQILYGELTSRLGEESGCRKGSAFYINHKYEGWEPTQEDCMDISNLTTFFIRSEAEKAFLKYDNQVGYKSINDCDSYYYTVHWKTNSSEYDLKLGFQRSSKCSSFRDGESFCILVILPAK